LFHCFSLFNLRVVVLGAKIEKNDFLEQFASMPAKTVFSLKSNSAVIIPIYDGLKFVIFSLPAPMSQVSCPQCTYLNAVELASCEICDAPLRATKKVTKESSQLPSIKTSGLNFWRLTS